MEIIDELYPQIKGEIRMIGETTLWVKTDNWKQIDRVVVEGFDGIFCKVFYEGADDE